MTYDPPINVSFRSLVQGGKFYTLDGLKEVQAPYYAKFIKSASDLSPVEINYIIIRYSRYNKQLGELAKYIENMKI